ncbi:hypothetical protein SAMN04515674_102151 [Pseudarcicella hirudinis]|uniref:Uncharacterized protein n=1 Tax=Pseudarcicella hirudinis TaxID=1079859 RepID=A0A1I5NWX2_9BACT|nr:hypothetical protein [Pseudarcicella hirudinis]SFP26130.1 hypothetical protein SAMN04515674_102151 [Pseudarcicella hirudinis]
MRISTLIAVYAPISLLLPVTVALVRKKYLVNELRPVAFYIGLQLFTEIFIRVLSFGFHVRNSLPFLHIYTVLEFSLICWFYYVFLKDFIHKNIIPVLVTGFLLFAIINGVFIQTVFEFNTYPRSLESLLIVCLSLIAFYKMFQTLEYVRIDRTSVFWINSGFTLYFSGNLFLFVLGNLLLSKDQELSRMAWAIHAGLDIFMNIFIAIGLWWSRREQ